MTSTNRNYIGHLYAIPGHEIRGVYKDGTQIQASDEQMPEREKALYRKMQSDVVLKTSSYAKGE